MYATVLSFVFVFFFFATSYLLLLSALCSITVHESPHYELNNGAVNFCSYFCIVRIKCVLFLLILNELNEMNIFRQEKRENSSFYTIYFIQLHCDIMILSYTLHTRTVKEYML